MRHIPSQEFESRAFRTLYDFHICIVPVPCSSFSVLSNPELTDLSQRYFICRQSTWIYKLLLADDYNSESIALTNGSPEHLEKFVLFCSWKSLEQVYVLILSLIVLNLLTLLFQKNFVCIIFVGRWNNGLRFLSNMESSYLWKTKKFFCFFVFISQLM